MIIVSYNNSNPTKYHFKYRIFAKDSIIKEE